MPQEDKENFQKDKRALDNYGRYSGLAFQMLAVIGVFTVIGYKLDRWLELSYPIFTILLIFLSVIASLYSIIRSLK